VQTNPKLSIEVDYDGSNVPFYDCSNKTGNMLKPRLLQDVASILCSHPATSFQHNRRWFKKI
jgi:hypothetical protein